MTLLPLHKRKPLTDLQRAKMFRDHHGHKKVFKDWTGIKFAHWTVIDRAPDRNDRTVWNCRCECGTIKSVLTCHLVSGKSTNCGCSRPRGKDSNFYKHGLRRHPITKILFGMIQRCENKANPNYPNYGGRGIKICDRWRHNVELFLADMGERPSSLHSIDRYPDKDGNYEPGNCRWATNTQQMRNTRRNVVLTINGVSKTLAEWVEITGVSYGTAKWRLYQGIPPEQAIRK